MSLVLARMLLREVLILQEERKLKGSGFFPVASLLNHDCLPNTARFDSFDRQTPAGLPGDTKLFLRALHDIPKGEELTSSYFPLTLTFQERQQRCSEQYEFACSCLRCQVSTSDVRIMTSASCQAKKLGRVTNSPRPDQPCSSMLGIPWRQEPRIRL